MNVNSIDINKCLSCGVCKVVCPKQAITLKENKNGWIYPEIDEEICIQCGICYKKCPNNINIVCNKPISCYASAIKDENGILESASGGIFSIIAESFLRNNGVVYGAALFFRDNEIVVEHIRVNDEKNLIKIKGSKYVQSDISNALTNVEKDLKENRKVLFSGTPCQIASLKSFLNKDYSNLFTIDVICHGTPSYSFFHSYLKFLEQQNNASIIDYKFRDKKRGWGLSGSYIIEKNNKKKIKRVIVPLDAYFKMFLQGETYRENCYNCKYAQKERIADITIGDYWGIEKEHPEYLKQNGGNLNTNSGISCVLVNTPNGESIYNKILNFVYSYETTFDKIAKHNHQLYNPSKYSENRNIIFDIYNKNLNFKEVNDWYIKKIGIKKYAYWIFNHLPIVIKKVIKRG